MLEVEHGVEPARAHEGARQQLVHQVFLDAPAGLAAGLAAVARFLREQPLLQLGVDHRGRQQPVFAAEREPARGADAVYQRDVLAAEGRDEAARKHLARSDRLERALGKRGFEVGQGLDEGKRESEQAEIAEEHRAARE